MLRLKKGKKIYEQSGEARLLWMRKGDGENKGIS